MLSNDQIDRYRSQINLKQINIQGQIKLKNTKVLVIGAGGIGSPTTLFLSRCGILKFGIIDDDKISKSNLHRQILFDLKDIGKKKVYVSKKKILQIDKKIQVKIFKLRVNKFNLKSIVKDYDFAKFNETAKKVAAGAAETVPIIRVKNISRVLNSLKKNLSLIHI